ncbi:MAG: hypothetical protein JWL98_1826 [Xanthomonadaceae bacterium]|nr:hypothetical protein [Xanthomonadaceae bacterium]
MRWLVVALVAILIVSVTWWKISSRSDAPVTPAPVTDTVPSVETTERAFTHHSALPDVSDPGQAIQARRDVARAQSVKAVDAGRNRLVAQFQGEKVDGGWATAREQSLTQHSTSPQIADLKAEPKNMTSQCRSSTCRITADFANPSTAEDWVTLFLTNPGTNLSHASFQTTPNADGTVHIEIYGLAK